MTTEKTAERPRYATLGDYLRVVRSYWIMIALIAVVGAVAGFIDAKRQTPVYEATAAVAFQDPTQDLSLVGFGANGGQTPAQLAATNAATATAPAVMAQAKKRLKTSLAPEALAGATSAQVAVPSGLLDISSKSSNPAFAANLANAVAGAVVAQNNRNTRGQFAAIAAQTKRQISNLSAVNAKSPGNSTQLLFYEDELARLQTLTAFAKSAQLAAPAQKPGSPVSPNTFRSTAIGLVLGLLLGILFAFVRDSMDRRLRNPHDIEDSLQLPVIGHVRDQVMGRIAQMVNGSAPDSKLDVESFRILRRNIEFMAPNGPPRSVVVTSGLPEEGKTTVAGSLALSIASADQRVLLVDCDLRRGALAGRLGIARSPGLSEFLDGKAKPQDVLRTVTFHDPLWVANGTSNGASAEGDTHSLVCIPSGNLTGGAAELLGSERFKQFLDEVTKAYDMVVLDSSPLLPVADTLEMLPLVDAVILCAREFQTTRDQAQAAKAALDRFPQRPTGIVVTGVKPHAGGYEGYSYAYGYSSG